MSMPTAKEKATPIAKEADVDTELSEAYDEIEMRKLLYPEGYEGFSTFSISTNKDAFDGWVKQFSGICCACAVAGSVNAVFGVGRPTEDESVKGKSELRNRPPLSRYDGLIVLQEEIRGKAKRIVQRYVRKAGLMDKDVNTTTTTTTNHNNDTTSQTTTTRTTPWIDHDTFSVFVPLIRELYKRNTKFFSFRKGDGLIRSPKTNKSMKPTTKMWLKAIREIVFEDENKEKSSTLYRFLRQKLCELDRETPPPLSSAGESDTKNKTSTASEDEIITSALAVSTQRAVAFEVSVFQSKKSKKNKKKGMMWLNGLMYILNLARGICKLDVECHKPSTYICGTQVLVSAIRAINNRLDYDMVVRARYLLGKKRRTKRRKKKRKSIVVEQKEDGNEEEVEEEEEEDEEKEEVTNSTTTTIPKNKKTLMYVSEKDGPEEKNAQWNYVRSVFDTPGKCVIFHLKNHYALVCAMRQYTIRDEKNKKNVRHVRELLTAKKGQRPRHWIPWDDAHSTLTSWTGYRMVEVEGEWLDVSLEEEGK